MSSSIRNSFFLNKIIYEFCLVFIFLHMEVNSTSVQMNRWQGKVAVVTGASSGIGLATTKALLNEGLIVVGFARRKEKMENEIKNGTNSHNFYARQCDVTDNNSIIENFQWVKQTFGKLNILINNAGVTLMNSRIEDAATADLDNVIKVNVLGLLHCTKEAIPLMRGTNDEAHIINVNSVLGHKVLNIDGLNVYPASKFAVRALSETLAMDLKNSKIRVSSVSPGLVKTELSQAFMEKFPNMPALESEDLASAILYILGAPPHVEIVDIILEPKGNV